MRPRSLAIGRSTSVGRSGTIVLVLLTAAAPLLACRPATDGAGAAATDGVGALPQARLRVRVESVRLGRLPARGRVTGTVRAFHRATITAEAPGRVVARAVEAGAKVAEGGAILELDGSRFALELERAEASLAAARTVLRQSKSDFARGELLISQNALSTQQYDDLRHAVERARDEVALAVVARDTAKRNLEDTRIRAPFAGTVDSLEVNVGDYVAPGTPVATLVDLSRVRIYAGVTAREAARLQTGTTARVSFADLGGAILEATLESVGRVADPSDGTFGIELWMDDTDGRMRDGLVAQIELPDADSTPRLLARRAALLRRDGHTEVFVAVEESGATVARTRRLRTGRSQGEWVEILDGLEEGERVIWDGHFALADGTPVTIDGPVESAALETAVRRGVQE
jgi:membrane fusion protein (multidrug efflux system)